MWFNLQVLKEVIQFYRKIVYWRSFLLVVKVAQYWKLNNLFFNKQFNYKFTFSRKLKKLLHDYDNYFIIKKKKKQFLNSFFNSYNFSSIFFYFLLIYNNSDYILNTKYKNTLIKYNILKKKYLVLLQQKKTLDYSNKNILNNIFLLYKNFYLTEVLLMYFDLYIFKNEAFFFNFTKLNYFLKYYFLRKCSIKLKLKIWDDCKFTVDNQLVFFEEKSIWLKNLEIFEESNISFFNQISLEKVFIIWDIYKANNNNKVDNNFKYLYYKYKYLKDNFDYLIYRINYLKKKQKIIKNFLFLQKYNINFFKNRDVVNKFTKIIPFLQNRVNLLNLIYIRRKNFKKFKKKKNLKINQPINILMDDKKKILYVFFYITFLNYFKKLYFKNTNNLNDIKNEFRVINNINKKTILNFKLLFFLYYKLIINFNYIGLAKFWKKFLFSFFFFFSENQLIEKKFIDLTFDQKLKIDYIKQYNISNIDDFLFSKIWQLLSLNFFFEFDNKYTKRYELLYHNLYLMYKKYWIINNSIKLKKLIHIENRIIKILLNLKGFITNLNIFKKIFEIYQLFSFKFFNLSQYNLLIKNIFKLSKVFYKIKFFKFKKFYKNKKKSNYLIFSMLNFLKKKISKFNLNYIRFLFFFIKKKIIKKCFKIIFIMQILNKKKLPLFLKLNFNINNSFYFFLEKKRVKKVVKIFYQLNISLFYIYLLNKFKYLKKYKYNKKYEKLKFISSFFFKKKVKNKKKIFGLFNYKNSLNINLLNSNLKLNKFLKKKLILLSSFYFLLNMKNYVYEYFLFMLKNDLIKDIILNINTHFLSTISFFDLKNDFIIPKKNFLFKLKSINKKFFFNNRYKNNKVFWYILKNNIYLEKLNILLNRRLIFITWFDVINNEKNWYKKLEINDYLFVIRLENKDFNLDYFTKITAHRSELTFLIQLGLSFLSYFEKDIRLIKNNENFKLRLLNRQLQNIDFNITSLNFYFKKFFFTLLDLKQKKFDNKKDFYNINYSQSNYINVLEKKKFFQLTLNYSLNPDITNNICNNCLCLSISLVSGKKLMYYQKFMQLNVLDNNILKFNFIYCNSCNNYRISLKANEFIWFFSNLEDILKYFIKNRLSNNFIIFKDKIQHVNFSKINNNLFFDDLNFINLNVMNNNLKFFFCYFKSKDKYTFNIKANVYNLKFNNIYIYLIMLLLFDIFFLENYFLLIPKIVKMYNDTLLLNNKGAYYNMQIEELKNYQKKNRIKITKKMKKERKLFYLNKFFNEFKVKRSNV